MISRRLLIEYVLMVGLPLILLLGVLHQGRTLKAPSNIEGSWKFALNGSSATGGCDPAVRDAAGFAMSISQSGSYLTATMFNPEPRLLRGRSEGSDLWFESVQLNGPSPSSDLLRLTGTVRNVQGGKLIRGALLMPRRVDCPPVAFEAQLQSAQESLQGQAER
jgi:hypothetical protein